MDGRSEGRFSGRDPEPRPGIPSGHMIGAKNVPFHTFMNSETKLFKTKQEIQQGNNDAGLWEGGGVGGGNILSFYLNSICNRTQGFHNDCQIHV